MNGKNVSRRTLVRCVSYLAASFVVLAGLAIQGHREAAAYRQYLSLGRLHAFAELSANLNQLDADLQKGVYASSPAMLSALCTQIFGRAISAQMALGELPYASVELEQTASFLQLVLQLAQERNVLVIHIYDRDLVASERVYLCYCECQHHYQRRERK